MSKKDLSGLMTATWQITENVQFLVFKNVSPLAQLKVTVKGNAKQDSVVIPTMTLGQLVEGAKKRKKIQAQDDSIMQLVTVPADGGQNEVGVYPSIQFKLVKDGELVQDDSDEVFVEFKNLNKVDDSHVYTLQGKKAGSLIPVYKKHTFQSARDQQDLHFGSNRYAYLNPLELPEEIVLYYKGNESRTITPEILKDINVAEQGLVRIDKAGNGDISHKFGFAEVLVLDLIGVQRATINDEVLNADYHIYTV